MLDKDKTKEQLLEEVIKYRRRILDLEKLYEEYFKTKDNLASSEKKYRRLVNSLQEGIWVLDKEENTTFVNNRMAEMLGYTVEEMLGRKVFDFMDERGVKLCKEKVEERKAGVKEQHDFELIKKDGSILHVTMEASPIKDDDGNYIGGVAGVIDITKRKCLEEKMKISEEKYRLLFATEQDAIFILDAASRRIVDANDSALQLYGYSKKEILELTGPALSSEPEKSDVAISEIAKSTDKRLYFHVRNHKKKDGTILPVEISSGTFMLQDRKMVFAVIRDITERKKAEIGLRQSEEKYRSLVDFTTDSIYLVDKHYNYLFMNKAHLLRLGLSEDQYINRAYSEVHSHKETELFIQKADNVFKTGMSSQYEYKSFRDGKYFLQTYSPVRNANNEITAVTVISKEITMLKQTEEKLYSLSMTDELTGLYNRRGFLALCEQQLKSANRDKRGRFLISADIDNLKIINDNIGHKAGDMALIETAVILKESFRDSDIIGRIGGDEFEIMVIESSETSIETLISRLKANLDTQNQKTKRTYELSLCFGTAFYNPEHPCTIDELLSKADRLMYEEKRKKKS